jgi:hypothetical protein
MPTNDEKREAIMIELNKRAISEGTTERYFAALMPAMISVYADASGDAVKMMGLAQALLRHAMTVFYGSGTTPADLQVRTSEDVAKMAGAVWDECCRNTEQLLVQLADKGIEAPKEIRDRIAAMPSDPSKRPDMAPIDSSAGTQGRPRSIADLLTRLSQPEPEPKVEAAPVEEQPKEEQPKAPTMKVKTPEFITWSGGSTMQELQKVGNGKGN